MIFTSRFHKTQEAQNVKAFRDGLCLDYGKERKQKIFNQKTFSWAVEEWTEKWAEAGWMVRNETDRKLKALKFLNLFFHISHGLKVKA